MRGQFEPSADAEGVRLTGRIEIVCSLRLGNSYGSSWWPCSPERSKGMGSGDRFSGIGCSTPRKRLRQRAEWIHPLTTVIVPVMKPGVLIALGSHGAMQCQLISPV
jgi:hypothetical protein